MVGSAGFTHNRPFYTYTRKVDDTALAQAAQRGDWQSMERLLRKYRGLVKTKIRSYYLMGGEKEDLFQIGMIGLWQAIMDYSPEKEISLMSFARICVERHIITAIKAATRFKQSPLNNALSLEQCSATEDDSEFDLTEVLVSGNEIDPREILIKKEGRKSLRRTLRSLLSELEWDVFTRYNAGLSYKEIADELKCTIKSVDNAVGRIKRKMADSPSAFAMV